jgi:hypothetical protein
MQELKGLLDRPGSPATTLQQVGSMTDIYSTTNGSLPASPRMGEVYAIVSFIALPDI